MRGRAQRVQQYVPASIRSAERERQRRDWQGRWRRRKGEKRVPAGGRDRLSARSYAIN